jgi:hypothetical protein
MCFQNALVLALYASMALSPACETILFLTFFHLNTRKKKKIRCLHRNLQNMAVLDGTLPTAIGALTGLTYLCATGGDVSELASHYISTNFPGNSIISTYRHYSNANRSTDRLSAVVRGLLGEKINLLHADPHTKQASGKQSAHRNNPN